MTRCLHVALHALLISLAADSISSGCISAPLHPIFLGEGRPSQFRPINMEMEVCFLICIRHYASGPVCPNPFAFPVRCRGQSPFPSLPSSQGEVAMYESEYLTRGGRPVLYKYYRCLYM